MSQEFCEHKIIKNCCATCAPEGQKPMLSVTVREGKYTVVQDSYGRLFALRHGEPWRHCVGDNLIHALASEVEQLREQIKNLKNK